MEHIRALQNSSSLDSSSDDDDKMSTTSRDSTPLPLPLALTREERATLYYSDVTDRYTDFDDEETVSGDSYNPVLISSDDDDDDDDLIFDERLNNMERQKPRSDAFVMDRFLIDVDATLGPLANTARYVEDPSLDDLPDLPAVPNFSRDGDTTNNSVDTTTTNTTNSDATISTTATTTTAAANTTRTYHDMGSGITNIWKETLATMECLVVEMRQETNLERSRDRMMQMRYRRDYMEERRVEMGKHELCTIKYSFVQKFPHQEGGREDLVVSFGVRTLSVTDGATCATLWVPREWSQTHPRHVYLRIDSASCLPTACRACLVLNERGCDPEDTRVNRLFWAYPLTREDDPEEEETGPVHIRMFGWGKCGGDFGQLPVVTVVFANCGGGREIGEESGELYNHLDNVQRLCDIDQDDDDRDDD